jgi:acetyl esterase/lipase
VPIYHLTTPEYSNQIDTVNFILKIYKKMLETYTPDKITVFGDSAGGNLIMAALAQLRDNKLPNPKNIILSSPFFTYEQYEEDKILLNNDPILPEIFFTVVNK